MRIEPGVAVLLCALLAGSPLAESATPPLAMGTKGAGTSGAGAGRSAYVGQIQGDLRIVHALNRFTFGARPGDVEAVRTRGLDEWFEAQLHPRSIPNTALEARLAAYPALQLSPAELISRYPSNAVIRQVMEGKAPMPQSGILRAVYQHQIDRMKEKREQKGQAGVAAMMAEGTTMAKAASMSNSAAGEAAEADSPMVDARDVLSLPPQQRVLKLAAMPQPELDRFLRGLKGPQRQALVDGMSPELKETIGDLEAPERTVAGEVIAERLTRDVYSEAQLEEVMTDFWLNHFNVYLRKNETMPYLLASYERDVIRPRALGNFEDLLEAVAHSPAMLLYLDQAESTGPNSMAAVRSQEAGWRNPEKKKRAVGLNENYARELMELHTLGVNGGYTQADVVQAAKILTGWTVERPQRGGGFKFDEKRHEPGTKKVMGQKFKEHGEREGRDLLHFLATRPATARFISRNLAIRFVSDDPPQALVDRMAKSFQSSHGDIAAVLRTMYRSPEFWSQDAYRAKVKTPLEFVVSAMRASNVEVKEMRPAIEALRQMGMPVYQCVPPTGYKEDAADWVSTGALVNRMNFALGLSSGRMPALAPGWSPSLAQLDTQAAEAQLEAVLVPGGVGDGTRKAVLEQSAQQGGAMPVAAPATFAQQANAQQKQVGLLAGLLLGSPEFQRR